MCDYGNVFGFICEYREENREDFVSFYYIYLYVREYIKKTSSGNGSYGSIDRAIQNQIRGSVCQQTNCKIKSILCGFHLCIYLFVYLNVYQCMCVCVLYCTITNDTESKSFFHFLSIKIIDFGFMHSSLNRYLKTYLIFVIYV